MNRRNEYYGQSGNGGGMQPERYPQQEWSDDEYRGGNRYRVDRPYAGDEQADFQRGTRASRYYAGTGGPRGGEYSGSDHSQQGNYAQGGQHHPGYGEYEAERNLSGSRGLQGGGYGAQGNYGYGGNYGGSQGGYGGNYAAQGNYPNQSGYGSQGNFGGMNRPYGQQAGQGQWGQQQNPGSYMPADDRLGSGGYFGGRGSYGANFGERQGGNYAGVPGYGQGMRPGQASYSGRGPRGYKRSDDRLKEDISERLTDDPLIDASDINVEVNNGVVMLSGQVDDRWVKHHVEDLVDRCSGVQEIENRLTLSRSRGSQSSPTQSSSSRSGSSADSSYGSSGGLSGTSTVASGQDSENSSGSGRSGTGSGSSATKK